MKLDGDVAIVGGGIGGLSAAIALSRVGIAATVFEQAPALREVGAAVALWPNAMHTLDQLGLAEALRARTHPVRIALGLNARGAVLTRLDITQLAGAGDGPRIVHRAELLAALAAAVPPERVLTGKRAVRVEQRAGRAVLGFDDGNDVEAALVVGADGLRSQIRPHVVVDAIRPAHQACYRGIVDTPVEAPDEIVEIHGNGVRCALCPMGPGRLYWWAIEAAAPGLTVPPAQRQARVLEKFAGFPASFLRYVAATDPDAILLNDLADRAPVPRWHQGRVVLLGDAAHPTTPNLGQGANMALDDGLALARALRDEADLETALARYERERIPRTAHIVALSRRFGAVAGWANPVLVGLREAAFRLLPRSVLEREVLSQIRENAGAL